MDGLLITAEDRYFTAGIDLATTGGDLGRTADGVLRRSKLRSQYRALAHHDLFDRLEAVEKQVVLAAQGPSSVSASSSARRATSAWRRTGSRSRCPRYRTSR